MGFGIWDLGFRIVTAGGKEQRAEGIGQRAWSKEQTATGKGQRAEGIGQRGKSRFW